MKLENMIEIRSVKRKRTGFYSRSLCNDRSQNQTDTGKSRIIRFIFCANYAIVMA